MTASNPTLMGTAGGTFLSVLPNIHSADLFKTALLAALGAIVSFALSLLLKCIIRRFKN